MPPRPDVLPLTPEQLTTWRGEIDKARQVRDARKQWLDANLKAYAPAPTDDPEQYANDLNTNRDFTLVERKKADLFFERPDVSLIPSPLFEGQEALLDAHTKIVNAQLGPNGVDAKHLAHQVLFDILCPAGTGWTVMGYDSATVPVQQQVPDGEPQMLPGAVMGLSGAQTQPMKTVTVPVPIYEECFWRWLSPFQVLRPASFRSTKWDDAPFLAYEFEMPVRVAKRKQWVPATYQGGPSDTKMYADYGGVQQAAEAVAKGVVCWYKSAQFRDDQVHPLHYTYLVLMDGIDQPAEHKDSPYQTLDAKGALTPDSLLGNPIHPCTLRTLTDAADVPSDCTISRPIVNELNKSREQMMEQRENTLLRYQYNVDTLPPDALAKIVRSPIGGFIGVPGEAFVGEGAIKEIPHGTYPRENFQFNDYLDNDLARTHALDAEQAGAQQTKDQTATEASIKQSNINARLGLERGNFLDWYCKGVTKYATLQMRFWTVEQAAAVVGPPAAQAWDSWRKTIPASLAFTALPDSTLRTDLATEKKRELDQYQFFINDANVDHPKYLKRVFSRLHLPQDLILPQPPPKQPEPMKFSLTIASASLNPLTPEYQNLYQVLTQQGVQNLTPPIAEAILNQPPPAAPPNTQHGGKAVAAEPLSKHHADLSGNMQGSGQPAPLGAGGRVQ